MHDLDTLDASELGKLIGRATSTVKKDLWRRPETLPPCIRIPGTRGPRWRVKDVREWLQAMADLEAERLAASRATARRAGAPSDFGVRHFALAAAKNGALARKRMEKNAAQQQTGDTK